MTKVETMPQIAERLTRDQIVELIRFADIVRCWNLGVRPGHAEHMSRLDIINKAIWVANHCEF